MPGVRSGGKPGDHRRKWLHSKGRGGLRREAVLGRLFAGDDRAHLLRSGPALRPAAVRPIIMDHKRYRYLYGPVPSRRLGRSLGIDLVPYKTCTYDCVYCQLGRTTDRTIMLKEYVPVEEVLEELGRKLAEGDKPDYITLAGSGEPTLNSGLGRLIEGVKAMARIPVAVITNGSLMWDRRAAESLVSADLVVPSLDAGDKQMFQRINRPHGGIEFERMVEGLISFREEYKGQIWLEVMLLDGWNDDLEHAKKIAKIAASIRPDRVQLNTAVRPPAEPGVRPLSKERLKEIARYFPMPVDIISSPAATIEETASRQGNVREQILAMLRRRPCTSEDVAHGLGQHRLSVLKELESMVEDGSIQKREQDGRWYYLLRAEADDRG